jgi:thiamine-monophosphate kinase
LVEFKDFFRGLSECAYRHGTKLIGGNIRERADHFNGVAFGIGSTDTLQALRRAPALPGDVLVLVGSDDLGAFWGGIATYLFSDKCSSISAKVKSDLRRRALIPMAHVRAGNILRELKIIRFCMDTSDGLLNSAYEIANVSKADVVLEIDKARLSGNVRAVSEVCQSDPRLWALGWGTYHLLCAVPKKQLEKVQTTLHRHKIPSIVVGRLKNGRGKVLFRDEEKEYRFKNSPLLRGEQFLSGSFWNAGPARFTNLMFRTQLRDHLVRTSNAQP